MLATGATPIAVLDVPTLVFVSIALAGLLGIFFVLCWIQERDVRPLAWWGSAYLIGAASMALWVAPAPRYPVPPEVPEALTLLACGIIWSGIRLFHGRELRPAGALAGALLWPVLCHLPGAGQGTQARIGFGVLMVAAYTFVIAWELWRERRKSLFSRTAAIVVPCLHAAIFLMPLVMQRFMPEAVASKWLTVFALESIIYGVGTAFIVLLMVKDQHVLIYRRAAATDHLTGLPNRRAFVQGAIELYARHRRRREPVTLLMFDLDHFKSINDRFGHAVGDRVLAALAQGIAALLRPGDVLGRAGGEEFLLLLPRSDLAEAIALAEVLRTHVATMSLELDGRVEPISVSIGVAMRTPGDRDHAALVRRADRALYAAKRAGRNRVVAADALDA